MVTLLSESKTGAVRRWMSILLVVTVAAAPVQISVRAESTTPRAVGGLKVNSEPVGARVYLDGALAGQTPLVVTSLSAGSHRVRVVKDGYLENGRVVDIAAGESRQVGVTLTRYAGVTTAAARTTSSGGGSLFSSVWFWAAVAGGGVAAVLLLKSSKPPIPGTVKPGVSVGIAGIPVSFTADGASDPGGKTLTYSWDFGDGSAASTATAPSHTFTSAGTFTVKVTVNNGSKSATATGTITIKTLAGTWTGTVSAGGVVIRTVTCTITQSGTTLGGSMVDESNDQATLTGAVTASTPHVTFTVTFTNVSFPPAIFTGDVDAAGNTLTGVGNGSGLTDSPWVMHRG